MVSKKEKQKIIEEYKKKNKKGVNVGSLATYLGIFGAFYALGGGFSK